MLSGGNVEPPSVKSLILLENESRMKIEEMILENEQWRNNLKALTNEIISPFLLVPVRSLPLPTYANTSMESL